MLVRSRPVRSRPRAKSEIKRFSVVLVLVVAVLMGLAAPAWAPRTMVLPELQGVGCTLPDGSAGTFSGAVTVNRFLVGKEGLAAEVELAGACSTDRGAASLDTPNLLVANATVGDASCDEAELQLGPTEGTVRGEVVAVDGFDVLLDNQSNSKRVRAALCVVSVLPPRVPVKIVAAALNAVIR